MKITAESIRKSVNNMNEAIENDIDFMNALDKLEEISGISEDLLQAVDEFIKMTKGSRVSEEARLYLKGNLNQFFEDIENRQPGSIQNLKAGVEEYLDN